MDGNLSSMKVSQGRFADVKMEDALSQSSVPRVQQEQDMQVL